MVQDMARISLYDGTELAAIEVYPGKQLLSFTPNRKISRARVVDRKIQETTEAICLLLSNGQKLTGSRDQKVATYKEKQMRFKPLADIAIGDRLRGERAGVPVVVNVIGLGFDYKPVRLVELMLDKDTNFVAEGILCR